MKGKWVSGADKESESKPSGPAPVPPTTLRSLAPPPPYHHRCYWLPQADFFIATRPSTSSTTTSLLPSNRNSSFMWRYVAETVKRWLELISRRGVGVGVVCGRALPPASVCKKMVREWSIITSYNVFADDLGMDLMPRNNFRWIFNFRWVIDLVMCPFSGKLRKWFNP